MNTVKIMKELLDKSTLTIQEMSELLGVSRNNFYLWKSGKSTPKKATVLKLSNILNIPISDKNSTNLETRDTDTEIINFPINSEKTIQLLYDHIVLQNEKINQLKKELKVGKKNTPHSNDSIVSNILPSCSINFSYEIDYEIKFINSTVEKDNKEVIEKSIKTFPNKPWPTSILCFCLKISSGKIYPNCYSKYIGILSNG